MGFNLLVQQSPDLLGTSPCDQHALRQPAAYFRTGTAHKMASVALGAFNFPRAGYFDTLGESLMCFLLRHISSFQKNSYRYILNLK